MRHVRNRRILARSLSLLTLLLAVSMAVLALMALSAPIDVGDLTFLFVLGAFAVVGGLIASRRPDNPIGWLCLAIGLLFALLGAQDVLVQWAMERGMDELAGWIGVLSALWVPAVGALGAHLPLRLPDGSLLSPRWRAYSRVCTAIIVLTFVLVGVGGDRDYPGLENPIAVGWADSLEPLYALLPLSFVGAIASLLIRYRRSAGVERLQLRWIAFGGGLVFAATFLISNLLGWLGVDSEIATSFYLMGFTALPIAIGIAVLRYRLYEIDTIINRAVIYGALTAVLAALYLGTVLLLQLALGGLTSGSDLAIAASTLTVAAAFRPARARIQKAVDRRFYRSRYDTRRTIESFSARLRAEIDLAELDAELRRVVGETMQPAHVSLWLRKAAARS